MIYRPLHTSAVVLGLGLLLASCGTFAPAGQKDSQRTSDTSPWPSVTWPLPVKAPLEKRVDALMARMTLEEKVGQLVQGDIASTTPEDVKTYHLGAVLAGGNSAPGGKYNARPDRWLALADAFHDASIDTSDGGVGIPVMFGIDAVHGNNNVVGATLFPQNIGLGAMRDPELVRRIGEITAVETRVTGMNWAFAPTVAVPQDVRWGRSYEGYSELPKVVARYSRAMIEGLQGKVGTARFLDQRHVAATVKHYVGDGGTTDGKDQGNTEVDEETLARVDGAGYPPAIAAGVQTVMASFSSVNGKKMHGNHHLLTEVLKDRMHFGGFVVGDWNGHGQLPGCTNTDCPATINAGLDMAMATDSWKGFYKSTLAAVRDGTISRQRLNDAVRRILLVKFRLGLFDAGKPSTQAVGGRFDLLGSPEHRAVARQAVRESLVLLKNRDHLLPLDPDQRILVAGKGADSVAMQSGGWTLTWQGTGTKPSDFPGAQTIWDGLSRQIKAAGGHAELAVDGHYAHKPDAAIVVFGESPYAEFQGDLPNLVYKPDDPHELKMLRHLRAQGIPVVAVFLSGRPLWVNPYLNAADAFVAAWLPGSEGGGVADVLLRGADGSVQHDFHGKLGYSWPRHAQDARTDPLFAPGYGLRYADDGDLPLLDEAPGVDMTGRAHVYMDKGQPRHGYTLQLANGDGLETAVTRLPTRLPDGSLRIVAMDHEAQEDARRLSWNGTHSAAVRLTAREPLDLQARSNTHALLTFNVRVEKAPTDAVEASVGCGKDCRGTVPLGKAFRALPKDSWTTLGIPLSCFRGADMRHLTRIFQLQTAGSFTLDLARVALGDESAAAHVVACPMTD